MDMPCWRWWVGILLLSAALWLVLADLALLALWGYFPAGGDALLAAGAAGGVAFMGLLGQRPAPDQPAAARETTPPGRPRSAGRR